MVFSFSSVNLSDFLHSTLIMLTNSLEAMSLLGILIVLQGHAVRVVAAVVLFEFSDFNLGGLPCFLLTCVASIDFFCGHKDFLLNVNMYIIWCQML